MGFEFVPVSDYGLRRTADLLTRAFADYFVKIPFTKVMLLQLARSDSVDLAVSLVALRDGRETGAALIARRGWTSRIAGMAMLPEARRHGAGRALLQRVRIDAEKRGDRAMVLEVIEQNEPAVRLYEADGFQRVRRLVGFSLSGASAAPDTVPLEPVDLRTLASAAIAHAVADLPWQLSGETLAQLTPPAKAFRHGSAWIAVSNPDAPLVAIRSLIAPTHGGRDALALLRGLMAAYPAKEWRMSAIWPEELSAVLLASGFTRTPLTQWQMRRALV